MTDSGQSDFVVLVCRGDERPPRADVEASDLILKLDLRRGRVSVLSAPGIEHARVVVRNPTQP